MDQKAEHRPFIGLRQGAIGEPDEGAAYKIIPFSLGMHGEFDRTGTVEKGTYLRQCLAILLTLLHSPSCGLFGQVIYPPSSFPI